MACGCQDVADMMNHNHNYNLCHCANKSKGKKDDSDENEKKKKDQQKESKKDNGDDGDDKKACLKEAMFGWEEEYKGDFWNDNDSASVASDFSITCAECDSKIDCGLNRGKCNDGTCTCDEGYRHKFCNVREPCNQLAYFADNGVEANPKGSFSYTLEKSDLMACDRCVCERQQVGKYYYVLNLRRDSCALDRLTAALTTFSCIVTGISLLLD
jgi:hypothetical protein